jgi:tape measure domain-containing protein
MVTENVVIRFVENGAVVVKRRIDDIGKAANEATRGIFLMKRALFVIGGAGILATLTSYADALTNMENRLRLTTTSAANLQQVQNALFESANRSRSAIESTADIYSRIALSARQLGVSQQQVINVTETLQKAAVLSGASAQEANAALVQLGQGLASDRLSGDELRSVLEQLPYVADILVDYLNKTQQFGNVSRGTLRELGREGKLTADIIFKAIEASQSGVDALFAQTQPTIESAFLIARNNLKKFIDDFDDATGASAAIASAIIAISQNIDVLIVGLGLVAAGFAASFGAAVLGRIGSYVDMVTRAGLAISRFYNIQVVGAARSLANAAATRVDTAAQLENMTIAGSRASVVLASAQAEYASATAAFANGRARDLQTGQYIANQAARDRLSAATIRLYQAEAIEQGIASRTTAIRGQLIAAETAEAAATTRLAGAKAAASGFTARFAATFPLLTGAIRLATGAMWMFTASLLANPITAIITAITLAIGAIYLFRDSIIEFNGVSASLGSIFLVVMQRIWGAIQAVWNIFVGLVSAVTTGFSNMIQAAATFFTDQVNKLNNWLSNWGITIGNILGFIKSFINTTIGLFVGLINAIGPIVTQGIPAAFALAMALAKNIVIDAINFIVQKVAFAIGTIAEIMASLPGVDDNLGVDTFFAISKAGDLSALKTDTAQLTENLANAGGAIADAFGNAQVDYVGRFGDSLVNLKDKAVGAVTDIFTEASALDNAPAGDSGINSLIPGGPGAPGAGAGGGGGANSADFGAELEKLKEKIELEKQYGIQKEINNNIDQISSALKRDLSAAEQQQVAAATIALEVAKAQGSILESILGPQDQLKIGQEALNQLFAQGVITMGQYNEKLREMQINADRAAGSIGGGFRAAIASSIQSAGQFGEAVGGVIVNAANSAADAIVEFAKTGQLNLRQLFADLFAQLLKLAAQRLLLGFLGGLLGIPGGFGLGGLGGFAGGGSILPTGPGSTDTQVVAFNKRPDERVDILTPGQQADQRKTQNQGGQNQVVKPEVKLTNINVVDPSIVGQFLTSPEGNQVLINEIQKSGILNGRG